MTTSVPNFEAFKLVFMETEKYEKYDFLASVLAGMLYSRGRENLYCMVAACDTECLFLV